MTTLTKDPIPPPEKKKNARPVTQEKQARPERNKTESLTLKNKQNHTSKTCRITYDSETCRNSTKKQQNHLPHKPTELLTTKTSRTMIHGRWRFQLYCCMPLLVSSKLILVA